MDQIEEATKSIEFDEDKFKTETLEFISAGYTPFSSIETRENGRRLMLLSFISLLLSSKIITICKGDFLGFEIKPTDAIYLIGITLIVCIYLLTLYLIDIYNERKIWKKKRDDFQTNRKDFFFKPLADLLDKEIKARALREKRNEEDLKLLEEELAINSPTYIEEYKGLDFVERSKIYNSKYNEIWEQRKKSTADAQPLHDAVRAYYGNLENVFNGVEKMYRIRSLIEITLPTVVALSAIAIGLWYYKNIIFK